MDPPIKPEPTYLAPADLAEGLSGPKRRPRHRLSCAECRRLKLKCDRSWPCSSCTKRGCARICPEGTLQAKVRSKDTSVLLAKIAELENLLQEKDHHLMVVGRTNEVSDQHSSSLGSADFMPMVTVPPSNPPPDPTVLALIDGIGTLNLSGDGRSRFLGLSASSALLDGDWSDSESISSTPGTSEDPDEGSEQSSPFRFFIGTARRAIDPKHLKCLLPERREAERLGNVYYGFVSHLYGLLTPPEFTALLDEVYNDHRNEICMTRLALLYAIFSLGVLFDPAIQALHPDGRKWHDAAETCLTSTDYLTNPTLSAVQTIHVMGVYMLNARTDATEIYWPILGTAMRLCQSMGLHRDGSNWGLELSELDSRRRTFHELLSSDRSQSLVLGRPYAISDKHYDTLIPGPDPEGAEPNKQSTGDFQSSKWRFSACIGRVVDDAFSVAPPSLAVVNRLDQDLRQFDAELPAHLKCHSIPPLSLGPALSDQSPTDSNFGMMAPIDLRLTMQQHFMALLENTTLLFLHRRAFALALSDSAAEPLSSPLSNSVLSVIVESSRNLVTIAHAAQSFYPDLANRWWYTFFHAYNGATCVATLLIKSPSCMLAKHAWSTLSTAMSVFGTAAQFGPLGRELLIRLTRLHKQAVENLNAFTCGATLSNPARLTKHPCNQKRGLRSLDSGSQGEASTPLAHYLESAHSQAHEAQDHFPCELGASTRLTRKSRTPSMSSSVASGRGLSLSSSSRSRGTSFGSASPHDGASGGNGSGVGTGANQGKPHGINHNGAHSSPNNNNGPNGTLATSFNRTSWGGLVSTPDEFDDEDSNEPPYWENLSVEPSDEPFNSPIFNVPHSQPSAHYFGGFTEHFHPPMVLPRNDVMLSPTNANYGGMYGPAPNPTSFESSPNLTPVSPQLGPLTSTLNSSQDGKPTGENLTSPTNTQFDLLDTFLTWDVCGQHVMNKDHQ